MCRRAPSSLQGGRGRARTVQDEYQGDGDRGHDRPPQCVPGGLGPGTRRQHPAQTPGQAASEKQREGRREKQGDQDEGRGDDTRSSAPDRPVRAGPMHGVQRLAEDAQVAGPRPRAPALPRRINVRAADDCPAICRRGLRSRGRDATGTACDMRSTTSGLAAGMIRPRVGTLPCPPGTCGCGPGGDLGDGHRREIVGMVAVRRSMSS